ncbi:beta-defensin 124 isoform X1 [Macaca fascicularis]
MDLTLRNSALDEELILGGGLEEERAQKVCTEDSENLILASFIHSFTHSPTGLAGPGPEVSAILSTVSITHGLKINAPSSLPRSPMAMTQLLLLLVALLVLGHVPPGRSEFKRCWKGQGACRTYCTRQETYMHLCPDASLCCLSYALKPPPVPKSKYE